MNQPVVQWANKPKPSNYPAAFSYLKLIYSEKKALRLVRQLRKARMTSFKAKDIFRASSLSLLGISNGHVVKFQRKIKDKEEISPILLVRDTKHNKVIVADGYHRLCATYTYNEDEIVPCRIV